MSETPLAPGWRPTTLGELMGAGGLQTGPFGSQLHASEYEPGGIPVVLPRDLCDGTIRHGGVSAVSETKAQELERYRLEAGDLLLARRGEVGRCALVHREQAGWLCGTGCIRLRPGTGVESRFLVQVLRWHQTLSWFADRAVGQTMANLNGRIVRALPLRLPSLASQRRLAEALEGIDTSLELRNRLAAEEATLHTSVLTRLLAPPSNGASPETSHGWRRATVHELCRLVNGHRFHADQWSDSGLPIIRIQNLNGSSSYKLFAGYAKEDWLVHPGDLLFAWAGSRDSLGPTLWRGPKGVLNQHIFRVVPKPGVERAWLYESLRRLARELASRAHGFKSTLQHLRKRDLADQVLEVPPPTEQRRIADWSSRLEAQQRARHEGRATLERLKQQVMDDLLSGARPLPVPNLPGDRR